MFQVISARYDRAGSIILTSNKACPGWGEDFAGDAIIASIVYRIAAQWSTYAESFRMKEKLKAGAVDVNAPTTEALSNAVVLSTDSVKIGHMLIPVLGDRFFKEQFSRKR